MSSIYCIIAIYLFDFLFLTINHMPNNKIYLSNLDNEATESQLQVYFSKYGEIKNIHLPLDKKTKSPKGYAFITFVEEASVKGALAQNGQPFLEQILTVEIATEKRQQKQKL